MRLHSSKASQVSLNMQSLVYIAATRRTFHSLLTDGLADLLLLALSNLAALFFGATSVICGWG